MSVELGIAPNDLLETPLPVFAEVSDIYVERLRKAARAARAARGRR